MTRKERFFCDALLRRVSNGADVNEDTLKNAALESFGFAYMNDDAADKAAIRRAKRLLRRPDIQARISGLFENAKFYVTDAVNAHIAHIRAGNYQALKDYWAMTQGPIAKRVDVRSVHAKVSFDAPATREPKPITARSLTGKNLVLDGVTGQVREAQIVCVDTENIKEDAGIRAPFDAIAYNASIDAELATEREKWRSDVRSPIDDDTANG